MNYTTTSAMALNAIDNGLDIASSICDAISAKAAQVFTYDNATALAFNATAIVKKVGDAALSGLFLAGCFCYFLGEEYGKDFYKVRIAAAELAAEDLVRGDAELSEFNAEFFHPTSVTPEFSTMGVLELRALCKAHSIAWRNVNGKGKHLSKAAMVAALQGGDTGF